LAIDRDAVSQKAFSGVSAPAKAVMYQGVPEWAATLPNGGKQDIEAAKKLLAETPYAKGFEFNMLTFSSRAGWPQATLLVAEDWRRLGLVQQVEKIVLQDMPHIPICERALLLGSRVRDDIVNVVDRQNLIYVKTVAEMKG